MQKNHSQIWVYKDEIPKTSKRCWRWKINSQSSTSKFRSTKYASQIIDDIPNENLEQSCSKAQKMEENDPVQKDRLKSENLSETIMYANMNQCEDS